MHSSVHTQTIAQRLDASKIPVLSHGCDLDVCRGCGETIADGVPCSNGCAHRGRRQAPRPRFERLVDAFAGELVDGDALVAQAAPQLRGTVIA